jgi:predicted MFS family arabinose efflux permease
MIDDRADLSNAIALNSTIVNGSRLIGPAIAGMVIAAVGEGYCFLIDGISYIAVIWSLLAMRIAPVEPRGEQKHVLHDLAEGWKYIVEFRPIRSILLVLALASLVGMPFTVLLPIMAGTVLHGGAHTLGFLMGASGIGALASAVSLALRRTVIGLGRMIAISCAIFGAGLVLFAVSRVLWVSLVLMVLVGYGMMQQMAGSNTIVQTIVDDSKRGRVMSYYTLAILGMAPFGSLLAGSLAERFGAPATLAGGGALCLIAAAWFARELPALRRVMRPIYVELGILPEG